jgi:hypothetical protein
MAKEIWQKKHGKRNMAKETWQKKHVKISKNMSFQKLAEMII